MGRLLELLRQTKFYTHTNPGSGQAVAFEDMLVSHGNDF
jgi:hypothetical protein